MVSRKFSILALGGLIFLSIWPPSRGQAQKQQTIHLQIGESYTLSLPEVEQITLSRKGVLHAKKVNAEQWILIGLKPGYTLLQASNATEHYFIGIFVGKEENPDTLPLELATVPQTYEKNSTPETQQKALATLIRYFPAPYFRHEIIGQDIHLQSPCMAFLNKKYKEVYQSLSKSLNSLASTRFYCIPSENGNYQLELFLTHVQSAEGHIFDGLRLQKNFNEERLRNFPRHILPESMREEEGDSLLSYPKLTFQLGSLAKLSSGGEMESPQILKTDHENWTQNQWKRFGLDFSFEAVKLFDDQIYLAYESSLHIPTSLEGRLAVRGSESQSQLVLYENQVALAGVFDVLSGSSQERKQGFLAHIPIIGPLFWQESTSFKSSTIAMFIRITKG